MLQLVNDNSTYKKINYNPLKTLKKDTCKLLENWRVKDFVTSTLSNTSCFFYPLIFFEFKNVCRAPYTWPHFGVISVPLKAIAFFRDRRHIEYLQIQKN